MDLAGRKCLGRTNEPLEARIRRLGHGVGKAVVVSGRTRVWFCDKCGKYSGGRLTGLMKERCRERPTTAGNAVIRRLLKGEHPDGKGEKVEVNPDWEDWERAGVGQWLVGGGRSVW